MGIHNNWIETAISVHTFHVERLRLNEKWRVEDTAKSLRRSHGGVVQYLKIASWLRTHENEIRRKCDTMKEALELIKKLERQRELNA